MSASPGEREATSSNEGPFVTGASFSKNGVRNHRIFQELSEDQNDSGGIQASATFMGRIQGGLESLEWLETSLMGASSALAAPWSTFAATNEETGHLRLGAAAVVFASAILIMILFSKRKAPPRELVAVGSSRRMRAASHDASIAGARPRAGSFDVSVATPPPRYRSNSEDIAVPTAAATHPTAHTPIEEPAVVLLGPNVPSLTYDTWTPPVAWTEASKQLMLPQKQMKKRKKRLLLNLQDRTLSIHDLELPKPKSDSFPIEAVSLHVKPPRESGVVEIYQKDTPKEEWMEHTFSTAHDAAQFQHDLLYSQMVGTSVRNMYEALSLVHNGSIAHDGKEYVLHDFEMDSESTVLKRGAVAWDDAMRCFSSLSTVRAGLEEMYATQRNIVGQEESKEDGVALTPEYLDKRHLMGYVDFFRSFVPLLPPNSFPHGETHPGRLENLLHVRKLVAEAAVLVKAYVKARIVVNHGWNLSQEVPEGSLTRRLAYDDSTLNYEHDSKAKNEYYEASVSRDVQCAVHSLKHLKKPGSNVGSAYQAYSLVGIHVFQTAPEGEDHPLDHRKDPLQVVPSLRRIIESNPDLDFFVCAFFAEGVQTAIFHLFVRSFPKGVDAKFDTIVDRFTNGTVEVRKRKLEVFMQLGPGAGLSPLAWAALKAVSLLLSWTRKGEAEIPFEGGADRTPFPGMTLSNYTETRHFGGSLQMDPTLPKNYVAVTSHADVSQMSNVAARVLYKRLEEGTLSSSIVDFTFVLEGQQEDELPERALATIRLVHVDAVKVALPDHFAAEEQQVLAEPVLAPPRRDRRSPPRVEEIEDSIDEAEPFSDGVDALLDILQGVTVPVRRENLNEGDMTASAPLPESYSRDSLPPCVNPEDLRSVPVLRQVNRSDLKRYFVATGCNLKKAAVRIVKSAAWRGLTFPVDTRECRIELQSGQFFQQGNDYEGNPVYYFQNMCLGPWRKDEDATISAVLHRLETSLRHFSSERPEVQCTVIILSGKPLDEDKKAKKRNKEAPKENAEDAGGEAQDVASEADETDTRASVASAATTASVWNPFRKGTNPRIDRGEGFHVHTNTKLISKLVDNLLQHYPERLNRALILPSGLTTFGGTLSLHNYVSSSRTRSKIVFLSRASELTKYVGKSELATTVGGRSPVRPSAFEDP